MNNLVDEFQSYYDISPMIDSQLKVWPEDQPYQRKISSDVRKGDHLTLSSIHTTLHLGAHADAPCHFLLNGGGIETQNLLPYIGPCQVIQLKISKATQVYPHHLKDQIKTSRVLIATGSFPDPNQFHLDFCSLSPELIYYLNKYGVVLVGIDTPSVDPFDSKKLDTHQALGATKMAVLEGLKLDQVPQGEYFLSALPLSLRDGDASPVRAALFVK